MYITLPAFRLLFPAKFRPAYTASMVNLLFVLFILMRCYSQAPSLLRLSAYLIALLSYLHYQQAVPVLRRRIHPRPSASCRTPSLRNWSISLGKFRAYLGAPLSPNRLLRLDKDGRVSVCIRSRFITRNFLLARKSGFFFQHLRIFLRSEADS